MKQIKCLRSNLEYIKIIEIFILIYSRKIKILETNKMSEKYSQKNKIIQKISGINLENTKLLRQIKRLKNNIENKLIKINI